MRRHFMKIRRVPIARWVVLCLFTLAAIRGARAQGAGFDIVGAQLARAIIQKKQHSVAVMDFSGPGHRVSVLGQKLADAVSAALAKAGGKLRVKSRSQVAEICNEESYAPEIVLDPESLLLFGRDLKVKAIVAGDLRAGNNDTLELQLHVYRMPDGMGLAALKVTLPMTAEMKSLMAQPAPPSLRPLVDFTHAPSPIKAGYKEPRCISCPRADYTQEAVVEFVQGTVALTATVNLKGRATDISIVRALPDGLTRQAINALKKWKLHPAISPNGNPVPARVLFAIKFQLT